MTKNKRKIEFKMNYRKLLENYKIQILILAVLLSFFALFLADANPYTFDAKLGIEFIGGVRIPVSLEKNVDANTMDSIVETLKTRINSYGLSQAIVRPVGSKEVLVEVPNADESAIANVKKILQEQGRFEGIIDGKQAVSGESVVAVGGPNGEGTPASLGTPSWSLSFSVTRQGAEAFSEAGRGKARYPVYMFLDRPENAAIILQRSELNALSQKQATDALKKEGNDIALIFVDELTSATSNNTAAVSAVLRNKTTVIVSQSTLSKIQSTLQTAGFEAAAGANGATDTINSSTTKKVIVKTDADIVPLTIRGEISEWRAIGLLSAPQLSEGLASGSISQFYSITGTALGATSKEQESYALTQIKQLKSVISGGKLPVSALVGSSFAIEPALGRQFLTYSAIATLLAIAIVALLIILRYKDYKLSIPIVLINSIEILILTAVLGRIGNLDLAAMAGIISLIGTGVDDQLIITDEVLAKKKQDEEETEYGLREKIGKAFSIIFTTAGVAIVAMMPLLLSGIVEISGFALATIIGILVGILITRPAFGAIVEEMYKK